MHQQKLGVTALFVLSICILLFLWAAPAIGTPLFALPADQNRINNFSANHQVWMVGDSLHLSFRNKTLQVDENGQFRKMNSKCMLGTATDTHYLYSFVSNDDSVGFINDIILQQRQDQRVLHKAKDVSSPVLTKQYLYYITSPVDQYQLKRYNLQTDTLETVLPWVSSFCVAGSDLLYTTGGMASDFYGLPENQQPILRYRNLETGEDVLVMSDTYHGGIGSYFIEDNSIFFMDNVNLYRFDCQQRTVEIYLPDPMLYLLNAYKGRLYLARETQDEDGRCLYTIFAHDLQTGQEELLLPEPIAGGALSPQLTVLDDGVWICRIGRNGYIIENHGQRYEQ